MIIILKGNKETLTIKLTTYNQSFDYTKEDFLIEMKEYNDMEEFEEFLYNERFF